MHFDLTISIGNIITIGCVFGALWRIENLVSKFLIEHETLMGWYCKEHGVSLSEIPTRVKGLFR